MAVVYDFNISSKSITCVLSLWSLKIFTSSRNSFSNISVSDWQPKKHRQILKGTQDVVLK